MRSFLVLWAGQACSLLGSQLVQFALVWWLTKATGSATMLALASLTALLPQILIGPFAGTLVDRWSRKTVMLVADGTVAVATLVLAVLFWLNLAAVWAIYVLLLIRATGAAFHWPAMQASTTLMVPQKHLSRVGGMNQTLAGLSGMFIPPLGALAIEALPMQAVLAIDVATAVPAMATLLFIAIPQPARTDAPTTVGVRSSVWSEMRAGLHFILGWKALLTFSLMGVLIYMFGRAANSLTPLLITKHFNGGALELGGLQSAAGIGAVIGGVTLGIWGGFRRRTVTSLLALALDGLAIIAIGLSPQNAFAMAVVFIFIVGFLEAMLMGLNGAIGLAIIPPEMQGRVLSLLMSVQLLMAPLGLLIAGPFADTFGVPMWWVLTGAVISLMGVSALCIPSIVHIEDRRTPVVTQPSAHV
ncbi:MAG: MFS transporter [Chloroflexi bacterium]|nr:MFS transporter [Chloroflexota bacterium]